MRRFLAGLLLGLLLAPALAAGIKAPAKVEANDGAFVSLPVAIEGPGDRLEVVLPRGFRLLSHPRAETGRRLLNLYLERGLSGGRYRVVLRLWRGGRVVARSEVEVRVRPRVAFSAHAVAPRRVVLGDPVVARLEVQNLGNVADVYQIEAKSLSPGLAVEPVSLSLGPGERGEVRVRVRPARAEPVVVFATVRSGRDPEKVARLGWSTDVLPFPGAERLAKRSLRYRVELAAGPSSAGWRYWGKAQLAGGLSDYVNTASSLSGEPGRFGLQLGLTADVGWIHAFAGPGGYGFSFGQSDWLAGLALEAGTLEARARWRPDPFSLSLFLSGSRQRLGAGLDWPLAGEWRIEPRLVLDRWAAGPRYVWSGSLGVGYRGYSWLGRAVGRYSEGTLSASVQVATRKERPFGLRAYGYWGRDRPHAELSIHQDLSGPWGWESALAYDQGRVHWETEVAFADPDLPWVGGLGLTGVDGEPRARARLGYRSASGRLGGWLSWLPNRPLGFGLEAAVREEGLELGIRYARAGTPEIGISLSHAWEGWTLSGTYTHDLAQDRGQGSFTIGYVGRFWTLDAGVKGDSRHQEAWLLLGLRLEGAFPTPEPVVELFGGRKTGQVEGLVFFDANRNGRRDPGERPVAKARLFCGGAAAESDARGRYRLEAEPGTCRLEARAEGGTLGLAAPLELTLRQGERETRDLGLVPIAGVSGEAFADANRDGSRDDGERTLPGVRVRLVGESGQVRETWTDADGRFVFDGLAPGRYRIVLAPERLPHLYVPAKALVLNLRPGPLAFVRVAAVPLKRKSLQTFRIGDVALFVEVEPKVSPPGGEVRILARVDGGRPETVVAEAGGDRVELKPSQAGGWIGYLRVPKGAKGYLRYRVRARFPAGEAKEEGWIVIRPGALASLSLSPALADPGAPVIVRALVRLSLPRVEVRLGDARYSLKRVDRWHWRGVVPAPETPGRYRLELWAEGRRWAAINLRVLGEK